MSSHNESSENYDTEEDSSIVTLSSYYLGSETDQKLEVYRRYLQNLNYTNARNISESILRNYAKMLFTENTSIYDNFNIEMNSEIVSKAQPFSVANSQAVLIVLTLIYVIIFVLGVLGNVVTCIVIAKNKSMHTAVNYYLFSLAVSDLLLLLSGEFLSLFQFLSISTSLKLM